MMKAFSYDPSIHYDQICDWARGRQLGKPPFAGLPKTGRVVPELCAVFLYITDSVTGFIESLIANPYGDPTQIPQAIDLCVQAIEQDAKKAGIRYIIGHSFLPAVADHAKRNGFKVEPETYRLLTKELS